MWKETVPALCVLLLFGDSERLAAQTKLELDSLVQEAIESKDIKEQQLAWLEIARAAQWGFPEVALPAAEKAMGRSTMDDAALAALGDALREADEPRLSCETIYTSLQPRNGSGVAFPLAHLSLARSLVSIQQYDRADSVLSIVLPRSTADPLLHARMQQTLGDIRLGQYREHDAWSAYNTARTLFRSEQFEARDEAAILIQQSEGYLNGDRLDSALMLAQEALDLITKAHDPVDEARAHRAIGNAYTVIGDYAKAAKHLEKATQLARKAGSRRIEALALNGLAYNAFEVLEPKVVEGYWLSAMAMADSIHSPGTAGRIRIHYGNFFLSPTTTEAYGIDAEEGFDRARNIILPAVAHFDTTGDERLRMAALMTLSNVLNHSGDTEGSRKVNSDIFLIAKRIADRKMMARSLTSTGSNYIKDGSFKQAIPILDSALAMCRAASMGSMMASVMYRLSYAHKQLGHYPEALDYMEQRNILRDSLSGETTFRSIGIVEAEHRYAETALADSLKQASALRAEQDQRTIAELRAHRSQAWLIGLGALVLIASIGAWLFFRTERKRRKAQFEREAARLETKALRAQMNPHFLFNALASINGYIGRNQPDAAKDFVARFGKLTRLVLENSTHGEVPLAKDLEALDLYLQLERSRAGDTFDYRINVDPSIDQHFVKVPPMVMQPLVENAIWHGIATLSERGRIEIDITEVGDQLLLHVTDNGVGIQPEARLRISAGHTSLGTSITRSRLDLIQQIKGRAASMQYLETTNGTKVQVALPM